MSNSPYPGAPSDPPPPQNEASGPLDPNYQHHTWTPPQAESASQGQQPQDQVPPGQAPYPPQDGYPQQPANYPQQSGGYPQGQTPQQPYAQQPYPPGTYPQGSYPQPAPPNNTGKYVLWGLGGCFGLFVLFVAGIIGLAYIGSKAEKRSPLTVTTTGGTTGSGRSSTPSISTATYTNSVEGLNAKLSDNYTDFSFNYPATWEVERQGTNAGAVNFVKVKHDEGTFTLENFAVGYFSGGIRQAPALMRQLEPSFASGFPNYSKISEGNSKFNGYESYELSFVARTDGRNAKTSSPFKFVQQSGDSGSSAEGVEIYGKVFLIPSTKIGRNGVSVVMLGTSKSPALDDIDDLGVEGELPIIIDSFRLGQ